MPQAKAAPNADKPAPNDTVPTSGEPATPAEPKAPHRSKDGKAERMREKRKRKREAEAGIQCVFSIATRIYLPTHATAARGDPPAAAPPATPDAPPAPKKVVSGPSNAGEAEAIRERLGAY